MRYLRLLPAFSVAQLAALLLFFGAAPPVAPAQAVTVQNAMVKVRPDDSPPTATSASIAAAQNEFEPFQIVLDGGPRGVRQVAAAASELTGAGGARIASENIRLYREDLVKVERTSNRDTQGTGYYPDPLVPVVDDYFHEPRNAFPFDVAAGQLRAIWAEVYVPMGTAAGMYSGTIVVTSNGKPLAAVPLSLKVRRFALPSTATLKSIYATGWNLCGMLNRGTGAYRSPYCGESGTREYLSLAGILALNHRLNLSGSLYGNYVFPSGEFERYWGRLYDGKAPTILPGAKYTSGLSLSTGYSSRLRDYWPRFANTRRAINFYGCDEPQAVGHGCTFANMADRLQPATSIGMPTVVTTNIANVHRYDLGGLITVLAPVMNHVVDKAHGVSHVAEYDSWKATPGKQLYWYQSCLSHGCTRSSDADYTGWPDYMVDNLPVQHRAMEWFSFEYGFQGELYYAMSYKFQCAWTDQYAFDGNGDGTLIYPGFANQAALPPVCAEPQPVIGGTHGTLVESIRLKLIREGFEDYEYLNKLCSLSASDCAWAKHLAQSLFPVLYQVTSVTPEALYAARREMGDRLDAALESRTAPAGGQAKPERPKAH
jgi:hypothetical protein